MEHSLFMPHGWCMTWNPWLIGLHVFTDAVVAIAYYSIPAALFFLVWRKRLTLSLQPILVLFGLFIALCGGGHLIDIISIWRPIYWFKGFWNVGTALTSAVTAIVLIPRTFDFIRMPEKAERLEREAVKLREQSSLLQTVIDSVEEGIILLNGNGQALLRNPVAESLVAADPTITGGLGSISVAQDLRQLPDGRQIERHTTMVPGYGQLFVLRDLTRQLQAEQNRLRLERIISTMKQGFAVISLDSGRFVQTNASFDTMHGVSHRALIETPAAGIFAGSPAERSETLQAIQAECERAGFWDGETRHVRADGAEFCCASRVNLYQESGRNFLSSMHYDITEQIRIKEDAARVQARLLETAKLESLGLLAGGVAHDFNNLLTGILGNTTLAMELMEPAHKVRPLLQSSVDAAERAAKLTNQLLAYSGKGRFIIEPVHLTELAKEISGLVQVSIPPGVQLRIEQNPNLPLVEADVAQIQQVVMNLVINGAEAVGENPGLVTVRAGACDLDGEQVRLKSPLNDIQPGEYVWLEVKDTGCGMDAATRDQIFDPFFTTKFTGRGLGLAAVQGIVRGHGGALRVESAPGLGSTFTVYLPSIAVTAREQSSGDPPSDLRGVGTILVVDDEDFVRNAAVSGLRHHGYGVITAGDGIEAIQQLQNHASEIAVILLDLTMPLLTAEETLTQLRKISPDTPVLLMSGYAQSEIAPRFVGRGVSGFLQKPFSSRSLGEMIRSVSPPLRGNPSASA